MLYLTTYYLRIGACENRLREGPVRKMYHWTTTKACEEIVKTGFKIGSSAHWGPGIYMNPNRYMGRMLTTSRGKTFRLSKEGRTGCRLKVLARLGQTSGQAALDSVLYALISPIKKFYSDKLFNGPEFIKRGLDSVHGCYGGMDEYDVYFPDQAVVVEACPIDAFAVKMGTCQKPDAEVARALNVTAANDVPIKVLE